KSLTAGNSGAYGSPRMAHDGTNQGIVWRAGSSSPDFFFATLDGQGQTVAAPTKVGSSTGAGLSSFSPPDLVWDGTNYAMVTSNGLGSGASVVFRRFSSAGAGVLGQEGVSSSGNPCTPAIAS